MGSVRDRLALLTIRSCGWSTETSGGLTVAMVLYVLADGFLPIVALVALGRAVGKIPPAVAHGLGSPSGHSLLIALAVGTVAYGLSLLRSPVEALLEAYCSAAMSTGMQRRLARAVCEPEGVEHLEDSAVLDKLASASGELSTSGPADAPLLLASALGDRLSGFLACVEDATVPLVGRAVLLRWLDGDQAAAAENAGGAGDAGPAGRPRVAAQLVLPGLLLPGGLRQGNPDVRPRRLDPGPAPRGLADRHGRAVGAAAQIPAAGAAVRADRGRDVPDRRGRTRPGRLPAHHLAGHGRGHAADVRVHGAGRAG